MIDIERLVYNPIAKAVREQFPGVSVTGIYVHSPSSFPHVSITESDNYVPREHLDSSDTERFATIMYEVNVYSNKSGSKKSECRSIINLIDQMMYSMNFTRTVMTPVPNMLDASIYRLTARYSAKTDGTNLYRN